MNRLAVVLFITLCAVLARSGHAQQSEISLALELVESVPLETLLDDPMMRNTPEVWCEMIAGADSLIQIETFYVSVDTAGHAFSEVLAQLELAQQRGVRIRLLADAGFARTYPEMLDTIASWPDAEVRLLDVKALWGGVLHAKCMVVDHDDLVVGSQNWDWRSLEHIRELGVRVRHPGIVSAVGEIMAMDWSLGRRRGNSGRDPGAEAQSPGRAVTTACRSIFVLESSPNESTVVRVAASPSQALPPGIPWDEPLLVELIDSAAKMLRAQVLTFDPVGSRRYHEPLECALKRAAARGVQVRIILSNWNKRPGTLSYVKSLAATPGIEVRFSNLPEWSGGFIPFARVEHPKYAIADDQRCWIGTSNWTHGGFNDSRNISLFIDGGPLPDMVGRYFETGWANPSAESVDPCVDYQPPHIAD
ncbi:hypothetical protein JXA88_04080 [Candidatus Fermentibacteria bacterium]|nr:hypothetical protein [Candidatus Fermentibacteria bacterium]